MNFNETQIAQDVLKILGNPEKYKVKWGERRSLRRVLENVTGLKGQIGVINAIGNAINKGLLTAGSQVSSVVSVIKKAEEETKRRETSARTKIAEQRTAAEERIKTLAIEKGLSWNDGLGITSKDNPTGTNEADEGNDGGSQTVGSWIGG